MITYILDIDDIYYELVKLKRGNSLKDILNLQKRYPDTQIYKITLEKVETNESMDSGTEDHSPQL